MAETPEVKVKKRIKKLLQDSKAYFAMPIGSGYGNAGVPDFLICHKGRFIAVEAKAGKGKTTALQDQHLAAIVAAGGVSLVINENNLDDLRRVLDD